MTRSVHFFAYYQSPRDATRDLEPCLLRDEGAAMQLQRGLGRFGFVPGELLLNTPPTSRTSRELAQVDREGVGADDVIVMATRPPIHDEHQGDRKQVRKGYTDLENHIFEVWSFFLERCTRSHIWLQEASSAHLEAGFEGMASMSFRQRGGAWLNQLNARDGNGAQPVEGDRDHACFLLRLDELWEGGPGFVGAFGMNGVSTLAWAHRLGSDLAHYLDESQFLVVRMLTGDVPARATRMHWAQDWPVEVALRQPIAPDFSYPWSPSPSARRPLGGSA